MFRASVKALVLVSFVIYLAAACYGVSGLKEGLERKRLSRFDSYSILFYNWEDKYFRDYPYRISVRHFIILIRCF